MMGSLMLATSGSGDSKVDHLVVKGSRNLVIFKIHFLFLFIIGKLNLMKDFRFRSLYCSKKKFQNPNHVLVTTASKIHNTQK